MLLPEAISKKVFVTTAYLNFLVGVETRHFCFLDQPCDAFMDHSSSWVFSKDTYPSQDMRLQVQNGCPVIFALFIGNT